MSSIDKKKILVLVEGAKIDVAVMHKLFNVYEIDSKYEIVSYCTNIYVLYQEMFLEGTNGFDSMDILQVLKSREKDAQKKDIFDKKYTDILLIFDLDPQDPQFDLSHIQLMQEYFCESSDMGKLYLNYPMIEAFYHLKFIPDVDYFERKAFLKELEGKKYKARVHKESMGCDYRKFATCKEDCTVVILQNLSKAIFLITDNVVDWRHIPETFYSVDLSSLLAKQLLYLNSEGYVYVLCSCIFYILDYNPKLLNRNS